MSLILRSKIPNGVQIIYLDNNSTDGTYAAIKSTAKLHTEVNILKNQTNIGFGGSFSRLIEESKSEYIMIISDEDELVIENINSYMNWLKKRSPDLALPLRNYSLEGEAISASEFRSNSKIKFNSYKEFNVISGFTIRKSRASEIWPSLKIRHSQNLFFELYPHVTLAIHILLDYDSAYRFGKLLVNKRFQEETEITVNGKDKFYFVSPRWRQYVALNEIFEDLKSNSSSYKNLDLNLADMQRYAMADIFDVIHKGMKLENRTLCAEFERSARRHLYRTWFKQPAKELILMIDLLWNFCISRLRLLLNR